MDYEESIIIAVIGNSELDLENIRHQNVGDVSFIKPYLIISLYIGFAGSLNGSTINFYCNVLFCCPDYCYKTLVTEKFNSGLIFQHQHISNV